MLQKMKSVLLLISIHAPAKGATASWQSIKKGPWNFNPRSREGSDNSGLDAAKPWLHFNPRSREGSDS